MGFADDFIASIATKRGAAREAATLHELLRGTAPWATHLAFVPVVVTRAGHTLVYEVTADYLGVGHDGDDWVRMPLEPYSLQQVADAHECMLPTRQMARDIYHAANATRLPRVTYRTTERPEDSATFLRHHRDVERARADTAPPGALLVGHAKDVVLTNLLADDAAGRYVGIFGWMGLNGVEQQPLYAKHVSSYLDYSQHGRLVKLACTLDGKSANLLDVCAHPTLYVLAQDDSPLRMRRYAPRR